MPAITIYHNPKCGTSRNVLELIKQTGSDPQIIEYLETPLNRQQLVELIASMNVPVREVMRTKEVLYTQLQLDDLKWADHELIDFMVEHPVLINRPIVVTPMGAKLCRPSETVLQILPH